MALKQYIGARYTTKIYENSEDPLSAEWQEDVNYEPLTMVTYQYGSYLSKKDVPPTVGNPPGNPEYWVQTGFYNGQIAYLYGQVSDINNALGGLSDDISDLAATINGTYVTPQLFGAKGDGVTDDTAAFQEAIDSGVTVIVPAGTYKITGLVFTRLRNFICFGDLDSTDYIAKVIGSGNNIIFTGEITARGSEGAIIIDGNDVGDYEALTTHQYNRIIARTIISYGKTGIYLHSESAAKGGIVYNEIRATDIRFNVYPNHGPSDVTDADACFGILLHAETDGWVNNNEFSVGNPLRWSAAVALIADGTNSVNNNTFRNFSPENSQHGIYLYGHNSDVLGNKFTEMRNEDIPINDCILFRGKVYGNTFALSKPFQGSYFGIVDSAQAAWNIVQHSLVSSTGNFIWSEYSAVGIGVDGKPAIYPLSQKLPMNVKFTSDASVTFDINGDTSNNNHQYGYISCFGTGDTKIYLSTSFRPNMINEITVRNTKASDNAEVYLPTGYSGGTIQYTKIATIAPSKCVRVHIIASTYSMNEEVTVL